MAVLCAGSFVVDLVVPGLGGLGEPGSLIYAPQGIHFSTGGHAANVALSLAQMGLEEVYAAGTLGEDPLGKVFSETLRSRGVTPIPQWVEGGSTAKNIALVFQGEDRRFIAEFGTNSLLDPDHILRAIGLTRPQALYMGTLGGLPQVESRLTEILDSSKAPLKALDVIPPTQSWDFLWPALPHADFIHLNKEEAQSLTGSSEPPAAARQLVEAGAGFAAVTGGREGVWASLGEWNIRLPAFQVGEVDATGAGDAFTAGVVLKLLEQGEAQSLQGALEALLMGQAMGAASATQVGATAGVSPWKVARLIEGQGERVRGGACVEEA